MIRLLDSLGPAIWRASWQAAALAILVAMTLRCFGERLPARWRFLLWGVVLTRMLCIVTPISPWSVFNLVQWNTQVSGVLIVDPQANEPITSASQSLNTAAGSDKVAAEALRVAASTQNVTSAMVNADEPIPSVSSGSTMTLTPSKSVLSTGLFVRRLLTFVWLAGCLFLGLKLVATSLVLRRRLSACRLVTDSAILQLLEMSWRQMGLNHPPELLVTPECLSPCIVGVLNPKIILPESIVSESSIRLRHVLAHELAHLLRGDLWTNWLLLAARGLHWFNPVAWWVVREMRAEREAACDELAIAALGETDRSGYAATIVELAASLSPSGMAPGLIGFFASTCRLKNRIERLLRTPSVPTLWSPMVIVLLLGIGLSGLTDAMPQASGDEANQTAKSAPEPEKAKAYAFEGTCINFPDRKPLSGVTIRLYRLAGHTSPPLEIAKTLSDANGHFTFPGLVPPNREDNYEPLTYATFGFADGWPIGHSFHRFLGRQEVVQVGMAQEHSSLSGKVIDPAGRPIAGATVQHFSIDGRLIPGLPFATTDRNGRFKLENIAVYRLQGGTVFDTYVTVLHPDYPQASAKAGAFPADIVVTMQPGCVVTGIVTDRVAERPAEGAVLVAQRTDVFARQYASVDPKGRFRIVVPEGRYHFVAETSERVCVALTDRECLVSEPLELPPLTLIAGGLISGHVFNTATGESVTVSDNGEAIMLGLYGPSQPSVPVISPVRLAAVDKTGRFTLRAAPGENYPYFVNIRGVRMAWDTMQQPPVVVKDGETTAYNMVITPEVPPHEKLKAARKLVESLSEDKYDRTAQIILEFRKLNKTVDDVELWCLLMRELVGVGPDAVPQLCAELDQAIENKMLRRLGFALRAIGDARAVPALIRAIPKTLLPSSSDYGLIVSDKELTEFMQKYDLDNGVGGSYFDFGRPEREIFGALHALTGQQFDDAAILGLSLSEDPRKQVLQRRIYGKQAKKWQAWWEANWQTFTGDAAYKKVTLFVDDEVLPSAPQALGPTARLVGEIIGGVLSPAREGGQFVWHFYDLDTGYVPPWPKHLPKDASSLDAKQLAEWASQSGADLMCVTHRSADGKETYVLKALGMKVREINARDLRTLDKLILAGKLPEGQPVNDLLLHVDSKSKQQFPDVNAAFIYTTREGNMGVIETTDRVTRTADLTGQPAGSTPGVGFHTGVRFNLKAIIP